MTARSQFKKILEYVGQARSSKCVYLHSVLGHKAQAHVCYWAKSAQMYQAVAVAEGIAIFTTVSHQAGQHYEVGWSKNTQ